MIKTITFLIATSICSTGILSAQSPPDTLKVTSGSQHPGQPAADPSGTWIRNRCQASVRTTPQPLIVIDNSPYLGELSAIDKNNIAEIKILKGKEATTLYGKRALDGVIIITTKSHLKSKKKRGSLITRLFR